MIISENICSVKLKSDCQPLRPIVIERLSQLAEKPQACFPGSFPGNILLPEDNSHSGNRLPFPVGRFGDFLAHNFYVACCIQLSRFNTKRTRQYRCQEGDSLFWGSDLPQDKHQKGNVQVELQGLTTSTFVGERHILSMMTRTTASRSKDEVM